MARRDNRAELRARNERARAAGYRNYYEQRLARARREHPGISTAAARGHAPAAEREAARLIRDLRDLPPDSQVLFTGIDRQRDGTWLTARFDVLSGDGGEQTYLIGPEGHRRLPEIADRIADSGVGVVGAQYLASMAEPYLASMAER